MFTVGIIHKNTYFSLINLLFVSIFVQITIDTGHLALPIASSKTYKFGYFKQHVHPPARAPCTKAKFSVFMIRGCQVGTRTWDQGARDHLEWNIQAVRAGGGEWHDKEGISGISDLCVTIPPRHPDIQINNHNPPFLPRYHHHPSLHFQFAS